MTTLFLDTDGVMHPGCCHPTQHFSCCSHFEAAAHLVPESQARLRARGQRGSVHLVILLMTFTIGLGLWILWSESKVVAVQPLGTLGSSDNGLGINGKVLETPQTYYPLRDVVALDKGVSLVLLTMHSGRRVICDERRRVCVGTSRLDKHIGKAGGGQ